MYRYTVVVEVRDIDVCEFSLREWESAFLRDSLIGEEDRPLSWEGVATILAYQHILHQGDPSGHYHYSGTKMTEELIQIRSGYKSENTVKHLPASAWFSKRRHPSYQEENDT